MSVIFDQKAYLKKVLPSGFKSQRILTNDLGVRKAVLSSLTTAKAINGREIKNSIYKTVDHYKDKYETLRDGGLNRKDAKTEAVNDESLLKQRIYNTLVYDEVQALKEEHAGELYKWLPSDAETPDPQHQLLYGKIFRVGEGDKDGLMPGERYGCRCGIEFLGNTDKEKALENVDEKFKKEAERMFESARGKISPDTNDSVSFGLVNAQEAQRIKKSTGKNLKGYERDLRLKDVKHMRTQHGNFEKEARRGQIPVKSSDIALIPEITKNYDSITLSSEKSRSGETILIYKKKIGNEYYYLESIGTEATKKLTSKTMWIKKA